MIRKSDLVNAINDLDHDLFSLAVRVSELEKSLYKKEKCCKKKQSETEKRKPGRPRKQK